jgi:glycosyltransferase involved in cell wall biosynthesis
MPTDEPLLPITVIIPARNAADTIEQQLAALSRQRYGGRWEVVVVDDASTDRTAIVAEQWAGSLPNLRVVRLATHQGISATRNAGGEAASGHGLLICDADDAVADDWVATMAAALMRGDATGGVVELDRLNPPSLARWHRSSRYVAGWWTVSGQTLHSPTGACCGVRREVWADLGGFNERLQSGGEDTEFFWRLQLAGYQLVPAPTAIVHYRLPATRRAILRRRYRYGRVQSVMLRLYDRHHYSRKLALELLGTVRRLGRVRTPADRIQTARDAAWVAGRLAGATKRLDNYRFQPKLRPSDLSSSPTDGAK